MKTVSDCISVLAEIKSYDAKYESPFYTEGLQHGKKNLGGKEDDITAVVETLRSDFLTSGPAIEAFETAVSKETGAKATISCSSGTAALHIAVLALGLGPGDWAIVPTITFLATANAVRYTGADVIFADVDPVRFTMDPASIESRITTRTRAIIVVPPLGTANTMNVV